MPKKGKISENLGIRLLSESNEDYFCNFQSFILRKMDNKWKKQSNLKRN